MIKKLPGHYIAGFVDGEGHFGLKHNLEVKLKRRGQPSYWRWSLDFAISLNEEDRPILEATRNTLMCGNISRQHNKTIQYRVYGFNDILNKIIPFFEKYSLRAKKKIDFILWKEAAKILAQYKNNGSGRKLEIKQEHKKRLNELLVQIRKLHGSTKKGSPKGRPRIRGI